VESERFDTLARHVAPHLSRRGLTGLALLALVSFGMASETDARKKRKKHKRKNKGTKCTGCTACQSCVNGVCQPSADGLACGRSGVCINGFCSLACDPNGDGCAGSAGCMTRKSEDGSVCVPASGDPCFNTECDDDADCLQGQACVSTICIDFTTGHCAPVIAAG
jgi:hypothetical protein